MFHAKRISVAGEQSKVSFKEKMLNEIARVGALLFRRSARFLNVTGTQAEVEEVLWRALVV